MAAKSAAEAVLRRLESAGFSAFLVGGCIRDLLLGRPVHDWDIAASSLPEETAALFPRCVLTGVRHGTVTVLTDGGSFEVTTFRADGSYADGRHPDRVRFVGTLEEDLSRRDFTVNAMAMDLRGRLVDLFGGQADLRAGTLRCVGEPARRFSEDALRMLRAVRFSAQLGFRPEPETAKAMAACAPLCRRLSAERVRDEMEKTLLSPRPGAVAQMLELGMLRCVGLEQTADLRPLERVPCEPQTRWAALALALPELDPARLRLDRKTSRLCQAVTEVWKPRFSPQALKRLVADAGWETARCVCRINGQEAALDALARSGQCVTPDALAISGRDLDWLSGPAVGSMLRRLLEHVLDHPEDNEKSRLLELAIAETNPSHPAAPADR